MIASIQNSLIKTIRKLHQTKYRQQQQLCLLEGTHLITEALASNYPLITVCYTHSWQNRYRELWQHIEQQASRAEVVSEDVLKAIATTVNPDGIVAVAPGKPGSPLMLPHSGLGFALETVQDPGNLGTIIRTAAAAGVEGLWVSADSTDLDHPKVLRASAGAWFRLPMAVSPNLPDLVRQCRGQGIQVVATSAQADTTYWQIDWCRPSLVLLGNEGAGLSPELAAQADRSTSIPMAGRVESLNVALCAALIAYEACRQRQKIAKKIAQSPVGD
ncbi:MAG: RNA methyltransferase [Geitlerinemataceae cyanobacterium]